MMDCEIDETFPDGSWLFVSQITSMGCSKYPKERILVLSLFIQKLQLKQGE